MGQVGVVNVTLMKCCGGRTLEGVGRRFVHEGGQKLTLVIGKEHH